MSEHVAGDAVPEVDESRRKFLIAATVGTGAVGAILTAVPFVASWKPSESARAAGLPTEVDLSKIEPGQMAMFVWRKQQIYVVRRTTEMLASLIYARRPAQGSEIGRVRSAGVRHATTCARSIPKCWSLIGTCTHLGCLPKTRFTPGDATVCRELAGRLLLSLPWFEVRSCRSRVRRFARLGQPAHSAVFLQGRHHSSSSASTPRPRKEPRDGRRHRRQGRVSAPGSTSDCRSTSSSPISSPATTRRRTSTSGTSSARWRCWCSSCRS